MISLKSARVTAGGFSADGERKKSSLKKRNPVEFPLGVESFSTIHKAERPQNSPAPRFSPPLWSQDKNGTMIQGRNVSIRRVLNVVWPCELFKLWEPQLPHL